ncbi:GmrSD restriction endonuclease domain-containing protein, partial [Xanthomonas axonopodis]
LNTERTFGDFVLPETDDMTPTDYVLDGQQRLTVVYSCLGAAVADAGFKAVYDLEHEKFSPQQSISPGLTVFPLRKLYETTALLDFRTALQAHADKDKLQARLDLLIRAFTTYKIPTVILKDLDVVEVCPIFERINSSGTKLSTYDLMVAATWSNGFDLDEKVEEIAGSLTPKGFGDIDKNTILKCLSAVEFGSIKDAALRSLRDLDESKLSQLTAITKQALLKTVDLLSTEFKIHSWDFLSYQAIVVIISEVFSKKPKLDHNEINRLKKWFWRSSFSERYKVGGEAFVSNDMVKVRAFVLNSVGSPDDFGSAPSADGWEKVTFRSNASRSRAFLLALALEQPVNLLTGSKVDVTSALSSFNKKEYHHVYPRAFLKKIGEKLDDNLACNICMLSAESNKQISDDNPMNYLVSIAIAHNNKADQIFSSNLLPKPSTFSYATESYANFIAARAQIIAERSTELCNGH